MEKINKLRKLFNNFNLDGYIIPKNDEFFGEYTSDDKDRLKYVTGFTGSFGFALILKNKNFLLCDFATSSSRYEIRGSISCLVYIK